MNSELVDETEDTPQKRLAALEAELLETKRAAVFFKQQGLLQEAKDQLLEIRRLNTEIQDLKKEISPAQENSLLPVVSSAESAPVIQVKTDTISTPSYQVIPTVEVQQENEQQQLAQGEELPGWSMEPLTPAPTSDEQIVASPMYLDISTFSSEQTNEKEETISPVYSSPDLPTVSVNENAEETSKVEEQIEPVSQLEVPASPLAQIKISEEDLEAEFMSLGTDDKEPEEDPIVKKLRECEQQKAECMETALRFKAQNNKISAIEWLRVAKLFEGAIQLLKEGTDVGTYSLEPPTKANTNRPDSNYRETSKHSRYYFSFSDNFKTCTRDKSNICTIGSS